MQETDNKPNPNKFSANTLITTRDYSDPRISLRGRRLLIAVKDKYDSYKICTRQCLIQKGVSLREYVGILSFLFLVSLAFFFRGTFMSDHSWSSCCKLSDGKHDNNNDNNRSDYRSWALFSVSFCAPQFSTHFDHCSTSKSTCRPLAKKAETPQSEENHKLPWIKQQAIAPALS